MDARLLKRFKDYEPRLIPNGDCLDWPGSTDVYGYGDLMYGRGTNRIRAKAHRVAWSVAHPGEPLPPVVRHTCDRRICVRAEHLLAGTVRDNNHDMLSRGRHKAGAFEYLQPVQCPMCSKEFKPIVLGGGRRKETCSKSCAGRLRMKRGQTMPKVEKGTGR